MSETEIEDRRQRALEAAQDEDAYVEGRHVHAAIEVATQVKLTEDILTAGAGHLPGLWRNEVQELARVLFTAAGFEVIE